MELELVGALLRAHKSFQNGTKGAIILASKSSDKARPLHHSYAIESSPLLLQVVIIVGVASRSRDHGRLSVIAGDDVHANGNEEGS